MITLVAVFLAGGALGVFVVLVVGIQAEEHRMSLKTKVPAETRIEAGARRVLGVGVRPVPGPKGRLSDHRDMGR